MKYTIHVLARSGLIGLLLLLQGCQKSNVPAIPSTRPVPHSVNMQGSNGTGPTATPKQQTVHAPTQGQTPANDLSVSALGRWDIPSESGRSNEPTPLPKLKVTVLVSGGNSNEFFCVGKLRLNKAESGSRALRLDLHDYWVDTLVRELRPISRGPYSGQPETGTEVTMGFTYPGQPIERVTHLTGQFDALIAAKVETFSKIKISELEKLATTDPRLKAAGVIVCTRKQSFSDDLEYIIQTGPKAIVADLNLKDDAGYTSFKFAGHATYIPDPVGSRHQGTSQRLKRAHTS